MSLRYTVTLSLDVGGADDQAAVRVLRTALADVGTDTGWADGPSLSRPVGVPTTTVTAYLEVKASDRRELDTRISAVLEAVHAHGITRASETTIVAIRADQPQHDLNARDETDP